MQGTDRMVQMSITTNVKHESLYALNEKTDIGQCYFEIQNGNKYVKNMFWLPNNKMITSIDHETACMYVF